MRDAQGNVLYHEGTVEHHARMQAEQAAATANEMLRERTGPCRSRWTTRAAALRGWMPG
ncbi:MAG: hypothetical protein U1E71_05535 [Ramlibacter sp.]